MCHTSTCESTALLGQELGAGADALIFQAVCVNGKVKGRIVAVKMQPRHKDTRWQVCKPLSRNCELSCAHLLVITARIERREQLIVNFCCQCTFLQITTEQDKLQQLRQLQDASLRVQVSRLIATLRFAATAPICQLLFVKSDEQRLREMGE